MADGPTGSTEPVVEGPTGFTGPILIESLPTGGTAAPPQIRLTELLADLSVLQQQETEDRAKFLTLASPDLQDIRSKLITWLASGKQGNCTLIQIPFTVPNVCSDGVSRNFFEYVEFVSGKSFDTYLHSLQALLPDFEVGYQRTRNELLFCVVRIMA
jgi:hypothetical protein